MRGKPNEGNVSCRNGSIFRRSQAFAKPDPDIMHKSQRCFPLGAIRRFENMAEGARPEAKALLTFVIAGDAPSAEFTDPAMQQSAEAGIWPKS